MSGLTFYRDEWELFLSQIDFTDEERKVIDLVRRGWCQEDIAAELFCSRRTIARRYTAITNKIVRFVLRNK